MDISRLSPLNYENRDFSIHLNCRGEDRYTKISYPLRYGIFTRLETEDKIFEFNLNNEIRYARSKSKTWIHPSEWLKRTLGNDWVYYSTGGYAGVLESIGEYYLPNLMYQTNSLLGGRPFNEPAVREITTGWHQIIRALDTEDLPEPVYQWIKKTGLATPDHLEQKANRLFKISGGRTTVLPPDARHSDYDIIPLTIADGCLYKCRFCKIKNKKKFYPRSRKNIQGQLKQLKSLYADDLINYNSLFIGEHDALNAPADLILFAARTAFQELEFDKSYMGIPRLYFFGSVDALVNANEDLFRELDTLPFQTHINIGLESADDKTLSILGKPLTSQKVIKAFERMQAVNQDYGKIEMTGNFVMDEDLPNSHNQSMIALVRGKMERTRPKGSIYLSPLRFGKPSREVLFDFYHLKTQSRLPMFLYIIQRL